MVWKGGHDSLDDVMTILHGLGIRGAIVGAVKHRQVEMYGNIHHNDRRRFEAGVRRLLGCSNGPHVLQETPPGTLHRVEDARTFLEGELIPSEISRVLPPRKQPKSIELVVYDLPASLKYGYHIKVEVIVRAPDGKPFTGNERQKLEKIIAGFLIALFFETGVETHGLVENQHGDIYRYDRVPGSHYGHLLDKAKEYAVELGKPEGLSRDDAIGKYLSTALSLYACSSVGRTNKSRHRKKYEKPG